MDKPHEMKFRAQNTAPINFLKILQLTGNYYFSTIHHPFHLLLHRDRTFSIYTQLSHDRLNNKVNISLHWHSFTTWRAFVPIFLLRPFVEWNYESSRNSNFEVLQIMELEESFEIWIGTTKCEDDLLLHRVSH